MTIRITAIEALESNYIWMIHNDQYAVLVDPGCAVAAQRALTEHRLSLIGILITHHHLDHTAGIAALTQNNPIPVWGPIDERIPKISHPVVDGDQLELPKLHLGFEVIATPGHTRTHIAFVNESMIFAGDTLFSCGCGRLFEGTAAQMLQSLDRLAQLNPDAMVYCGHEYTASNCQFARNVEPDNQQLLERHAEVVRLRQAGHPTLPVTLGKELQTNPFLRTREQSVVEAAGQHNPDCGTSAEEVFATLRNWKDQSA